MPLALSGQTPPVSTPAQAQPTAQADASPQSAALAREAPGAVYKEAMRPLDVVRASLGN
jgi:hypothetical protein